MSTGQYMTMKLWWLATSFKPTDHVQGSDPSQTKIFSRTLGEKNGGFPMLAFLKFTVENFGGPWPLFANSNTRKRVAWNAFVCFGFQDRVLKYSLWDIQEEPNNESLAVVDPGL